MKSMLVEQITILLPSPPSRGAWIEILIGAVTEQMRTAVAPLAGGVD